MTHDTRLIKSPFEQIDIYSLATLSKSNQKQLNTAFC